jgi:heptosyltransferase-1
VAPDPQQGGLPRRILVVRTGAIGDVVNALVFATAVKDADADVRVGWAVHPLALPLVEDHPSVDRAHVIPRAGGAGAFLGALREIRAEEYELAVDLQRITKSGFLARCSGAPRVLGYDRARSKEGSWLWSNERIPAGPPHAHMVEQYLEFARYLGLMDATARHVLPRDPQAERWAEEQLERMGGAPLVVAVGASKPPNRWLPERFARLAGELAGDAPVCLVGGPEDRGATPGAGAGVHDLVGATSLRQLSALLARARLFAGCDTGPMHLAAAVGTPVVALFGPADERRTGPFGEGHRVVRAESGRMEDIAVDDVLVAVREVLSARDAG